MQALINRLSNFILYNWRYLEDTWPAYLPATAEVHDYFFWVTFLRNNFSEPKKLKSFIQHLSKYEHLPHAERKKLNGILSHLPNNHDLLDEMEYPQNNATSLQQISLVVIHHESDTEHVKQLERQLSPVILRKRIELFARYKINPGQVIDVTQETALNNANFIVCMMSADLLSDKKSVAQILAAKRRFDQYKKNIIPIIVSWCNWSDLLGPVQHLPRSKSCILEYEQIEKAYFDIAQEIEMVIKSTESSPLP